MKYQFEWDIIKAKSNLQKHGVSFKEATEVFLDPLHLSILDSEHGKTEERWITLGESKTSQLRIVVHTVVEHYDEKIISIRVISARPASKFEQQQYREAQ